MSKLFQLFIGNKNYSSWSLVSWLCLKYANIEFKETKILLGIKGSKKKILEASPSGHLPVLKTNNLLIHDSLAIAEYINELKNGILYPKNIEDRAICRAIISEIHSGFNNFRNEAPMNIRKRHHNVEFTKNATHEINRIISIFTNLLESSKSSFLFDEFSLADIFYTPIILRFINYNITYPSNLNQYFQKILQNQYIEEWIEDAKNEVETIEIIDNLQKAKI